jgi:hypothetical protein
LQLHRAGSKSSRCHLIRIKSGRGAAWISALAWGARGRGFKSRRPDHFSKISKSDSTTIHAPQKADSHRGNRSGESATAEQNPILFKLNPDASTGDLTALLRQYYGSDLAAVIERWPALPEHIKAAVLALLKAEGK